MMSRLPAGASAAEVEEVEMAAELREIVLLENFCFFAARYFKFYHGFPTGIASGRELAELYLHTVEYQALTAHRRELSNALLASAAAAECSQMKQFNSHHSPRACVLASELFVPPHAILIEIVLMNRIMPYTN